MELQAKGVVSKEEPQAKVLVPRQDLTGADRMWAMRYNEGDVLRYSRSSQERRFSHMSISIHNEVCTLTGRLASSTGRMETRSRPRKPKSLLKNCRRNPESHIQGQLSG